MPGIVDHIVARSLDQRRGLATPCEGIVVDTIDDLHRDLDRRYLAHQIDPIETVKQGGDRLARQGG